jgi:hypothetical protein
VPPKTFPPFAAERRPFSLETSLFESSLQDEKARQAQINIANNFLILLIKLGLENCYQQDYYLLNKNTKY